MGWAQVMAAMPALCPCWLLQLFFLFLFFFPLYAVALWTLLFSDTALSLVGISPRFLDTFPFSPIAYTHSILFLPHSIFHSLFTPANASWVCFLLKAETLRGRSLSGSLYGLQAIVEYTNVLLMFTPYFLLLSL